MTENYRIACKFIKLGQLAHFPGESPNDHFAVLVDARRGSESEGLVLQHPALTRILERDHRLPDEYLKPRIPLSKVLEPNDDYSDPFKDVDRNYDGRWLAASSRVLLHDQPTGLKQPTDTGLRVIVQERYDTLIGSALGNVWHNLLLLGAATFALTILFVAPLWAFVFRALAKP